MISPNLPVPSLALLGNFTLWLLIILITLAVGLAVGWWLQQEYGERKSSRKEPLRPALKSATAVPKPKDDPASILNREIVESAPLVVGLLDRESRAFRFLSPYVYEVLGYSPEELIARGKEIFGTILDPDSEANWQEHFRCLDEGPDSMISELLVKARHRDGRRCWLLFRDRALHRSESGKVREVLSMSMDMTLLMESRRRILESRDAAEAASRAKDAFMALISHELHTPLNAVFGGVQLMQMEDLTPSQQDSCGFILEGAQALQKLFSNLLEYSQAQAESAVGADEEIQLVEEMELLAVRGMEMASARGLEWNMEADPALPAIVRGDRSRLMAVIQHILENAIKFTPEGKVGLSVRQMRKEGNQVWVQIVVSDTGVGMTEDVRNKVFTSFSQAEEALTRSFSGAGIGLTIAARHLEVMGGRIEAESHPGQGSRFRLEIPFKLASNSVASAV